MAKIQNNFISGILDKDNNRRIIPSDALIDAENFIVITTDNSNRGVGRNVPGNLKLTTNSFTLPEVLGSRTNSTDEKIYYFVKTSTFDYVLEFNFITKTGSTVLQATTGGALNFQTGKRIINIDIIYSGEPYDSVTQQGGNLLAWSGDDNPPRIGNIERMKMWGTDGFTSEEIMLIKAPPLFPPFTTLLNTISEEENFIKDKFISFSTRFKYKDGYYSAISPWEEYSFLPKAFDLDFNSKQNSGMVNSFNSVNLKFSTGPREVIAIDVLFKYSNSSTVYKMDQYIKLEQGWADNIIIPTAIPFNNGKVYQILPDSQYFRNFDNVPETTYGQTLIGSRIAFANYKEGKNMIDKNGDKVQMTYTTNVVSVENVIFTPIVTSLNSVSPFDASTIVKGKIRIDFTGILLKQDFGIVFTANLITLAVSPPLTPSRPVTTFGDEYSFEIPSDYANISDLVNDTANGFKTDLEGYFSITIRNQNIPPPNALPYPPDPPVSPPYSIFNGLQVSVISANVIEINLPTIQFEINNTPNPNTFVKEYYTNTTSEVIVQAAGNKKSMKSYRSYEIAMIHTDLQGRKTTATVSPHNMVFIPISASNKKNIITVDLTSQKPPAWAVTYKFAIKENKVKHEEIYVTQFYEEDSIYRWVKIDGENVNKIKENDILLVKADVNHVLPTPVFVTVLEIKNQPKDFIVVTEGVPAGLYMKIVPAGFSMPYNPDAYRQFYDDDASHERPSAIIFIDKPVPNGSTFNITIHSSFGGDNNGDNTYTKSITANMDYADFGSFFTAQIDPIPFQGNNTGADFGGVYPKSLSAANTLKIDGTSSGSSKHNAFIDVTIILTSNSGLVIFETLGVEVNDGIYYETPDLFATINGDYILNDTNDNEERRVVNSVHYLEKTFNCFMMGNGAESYQILDAWNAKYLSIDFCPTAVSENSYRQINRFADITYSEPYNTNTNVNRLNEFNLSLANFKDDIEKSYGPIIKIAGLDTNLEVFQEDKDSIVYYGKDLLFNADGTTNLTGIPQVLGVQQTYEGEYGISLHPESYARYGFNTFHTDVKRGVVVKKSNNGLFEISSQGMTNYFKTLFKNTKILNIIGEYDQYNEQYVLNIKYIENSITKYVTWLYSDKYNGWNTRHTFNPEDMCRLNNNLLSFNSGELYLHNQPLFGAIPNYNTFYGVVYPSTFEFVFSQSPSDRKIFSTLEIEGTIPLEIITKTDLNDGYINGNSFEKKEGIFYSYIRNSNGTIDTSLLSCQGIGNATVTGLALVFSFPLDPMISIGDKIININKLVVGTILSKTETTLVLDTMLNIVSGDYVICAKTQSIDVNSMLGYYLNVKASFNNTSEQEVFAINSEITKSYM